MERTEYLQKPIIKGVVFKIGTDETQVYDDSTIFIHARNCRRITPQEGSTEFPQSSTSSQGDW